MRITILAAVERSAASAVDAAMLDGSALAAALERAGHEPDLIRLPAPDHSWLERGVAAVETAAALANLAMTRPVPDAVVVVAPPNGAALLADMVAGVRGIRGVVALASLGVEARLRTGELNPTAWFNRAMSQLERQLLRRARSMVVPKEAMRRQALSAGARPQQVRVVEVLLSSSIIPRPPDARVQAMRSDLAEGARCLALLPAALGAATDLSALAGALTRLRHDLDFSLAAVGGGSRAEALQDMLSARGVNNARVVTLSRSDRRAAVHAADMLIGIAVPAQDGLCVPRALTRALWAGKPLVAVGPDGSDLLRDVTRLGIGPCVSAGDGDGLATTLRALASDQKLREQFSERARQVGQQMQSPVSALLEALDADAPLVHKLSAAPA